MDFTSLVESGKYKKSDMDEKGQRYIDGMTYVLDVADEFLLNTTETEEDSDCPTLANLKNECATAVIKNFKDWLYHLINQMIVEMVDGVVVEGDEK